MLHSHRFVSGTLADHVSKFPQAWADPGNRPDAAICTVQYDFVRYYQDRINRIKGYTKTKFDKGIVRGWKIHRSTERGTVEVFWQDDASLNSPWRGVDGSTTGPGFLLLRNATPTAPVPVLGKFLTQDAALLARVERDLKHPAMKKHLASEGLEDSLDWLLQCVKDGAIPILKVYIVL